MKQNETSLNRVMEYEADCDMSRASYSQELSAAGFEEGTHQFFATYDKIQFKSVVDIVGKILHAHGYSDNLENILASVGSFRLSFRVRMTPRSVGSERPVVKHFMPCVQFELPSKGRVCPLLQRFYSEISKYEHEIDYLRGKKRVAGDRNSLLSPRQMRRENKKLKTKLAQTEQQVEKLAAQLADAKRSQNESEKALRKQNVLPPGVRVGVVKTVLLEEREVVVSAGQQTFRLPLCQLELIPKQNQMCLLQVDRGHPRALLPIEDAEKPVARWAEVLFVDGPLCKVRDDARYNWLIRAHNPLEQEIVNGLHRGDRIILYFHANHITRFERLTSNASNQYGIDVGDAIAMTQSTGSWSE